MIRAIDQLRLEIHERVTGNRAVRGSFDNAFLDRRAILLWHCAAKNLVFKDKSFTARQRFEDHLAIAKLSAPAGLFLMPALHLGALRNRFFVRNFRRMQHHLNAVTLLQLLDDGFDMDLAGAGQQKLFRLRVARKCECGIFFQNLVNRDADLFFVLSRFWFDCESDRGFGILHGLVDDWFRLVTERVARLRLFQLYTGDDVAGIRFRNFVKLLTLHRVQRAEAFRGAASRVIDVRVGSNLAADHLHDINTAGKRIGDGAKTVS